jgi:hypothetical protein
VDFFLSVRFGSAIVQFFQEEINTFPRLFFTGYHLTTNCGTTLFPITRLSYLHKTYLVNTAIPYR